MKKICLFFLFSFALLSAPLGALASEENPEPDTESADETSADPSLWKEYQLQIDDEVYRFPMSYSSFANCGWSCDGMESGTMEPWNYERYLFYRGEECCSAYLLNLSDDTISLDACTIGGMVVEEHDWEDSGSKISLPGDLVRGASTGEDIVAAYGMPDELCEGSLYTIYVYREDSNREVELEVYNKTGFLENIRIENFTESENIPSEKTEEETPAAVLAYEKPESLSPGMMAYEIELDGSVYALPVPVCALIEDGWEVVEAQSDSEIPALYYGWVTLKKGDLCFTQAVRNSEENALGPENCWLESLEISREGLEAEGSLPGKVRVGMTEKRFLDLLAENAVVYQKTENGEESSYIYNSNGFGHCCEVRVTDGFVLGISCENSLE